MRHAAQIVLLGSLLLGCGNDPGSADPDASLTSSPKVFLNDETLGPMTTDPTLQIIDVRDLAAFESGHVPAALHLEASRLRAMADGVSGQVTDLSASQAVFAEVGLKPGSKVVIYGESTNTRATRVFWTLKYYGHTSVAVLDGGFAAWSGATEVGAPQATPSSYSIADTRTELRVDADWVLDHLDDASVVLVDARSSAEYAAGHIPGALSIDWPRNLRDGALLPIDEVRSLYSAIQEGSTVVTYCQTGSRAAVAFAVAQWLGFADVRLYDGSWAEWGSRQDLPKE